ncbi:hypothetical protein TorRG33x02_236600 [Trema orientale]|uniref:Uncharacterized protein n=1 Tax=Trema orientale TaxID=63057 RepID=A0A2P5E0V1_TREOI|nr:hypothetical protein TorRG33x02_236600 [Trema orientale]
MEDEGFCGGKDRSELRSAECGPGLKFGAPTPLRNVPQDLIGWVATTGRWSESPEPPRPYRLGRHHRTVE